VGEKKLVTFSYNIHKGFSSGNHRFILNNIRSALRSVHPDLVFLQEVQGQNDHHSKRVTNWPDQPQFEFLAHELWPHFAYGKNAVYTSGHHGNAILSKYPFSFYENINISTNSMEKRGLLHGVIDVPIKCPNLVGTKKTRRVHLICVHLGLLEAERTEQIRRLCARIVSHVPHNEPLIIGGDFNDWRNKVSGALRRALSLHEAFEQVDGMHARTFPIWFPALRLDRIYYRGLKVQGAKCLKGAPWRQLSDHAALVAELAFE
jgi:endonuclease/exonuclease/phosphatase family metal-dependent hydrolase